MNDHKWTMDKALTLIREIEPTCKQHGYFLGLCGGVLRKGYSDKDLDIILIPMNADMPGDVTAVLKYLVERFGPYRVQGFYRGEPMQNYQPLRFHSFRQNDIDIDIILQQTR